MPKPHNVIKSLKSCLHFLVPHVSVKNVVVFENEGPVTIQFMRTGGDLSLPTRLFASTRMAQGMYSLLSITIMTYINICNS